MTRKPTPRMYGSAMRPGHPWKLWTTTGILITRLTANPWGLEFLYVSKGVNLAGLPEQPILRTQLTPFNLTVLVREQTKGAAD